MLDSRASPNLSNVGVIFSICVLVGFAMTWLNQLLYQTQSPFFDSLSYYEKLHRVMSYTRSGGFAEGLRETLYGANTVCLPFLIAILLAYVFEPCREIGIWIQIGELFLFLWSLDFYLRRFEKVSRSGRVAVIGGFFTMACLYYQNGGLSDFRMDLSLMLLFGLSAIWLLAALQDQSYGSYFKLGMAIAATCLFRATAPVYFTVAFGPPLIWQLWRSRKSAPAIKRSLLGIAVGIATVIVFAGWYFVINFDYLYYYYFVWNTDANARIPWWQTLEHLDLVKRAIGEPALACFAALAAIGAHRVHKVNSTAPLDVTVWIGALDWRLLWIAAAPTLMLIIRRAGLNPFVSFPTAIGLFLLAISLVIAWSRHFTKRDRQLLCACILISLALSGARAWKKHRFTDEGSMAAHRAITALISEDARQRGLSHLHFETLQTTELCTSSLWSSLLFDTPQAEVNNHQVRLGNMQLMPSRVFFLPAAADWNSVTGDTDGAKASTLVNAANSSIDYLVMPEDESLDNIVHQPYAPVINQQTRDLKTALLATGNWQAISQSFQDVPGRTYRVYRNLDRTSDK